MTSEFAETIALQALAWVMADDELSSVFMGATGVSAEALAGAATDPETLVSVLTFLTMDDEWVRQFCDRQDLAYDLPLKALYALPGNGQVHWT